MAPWLLEKMLVSTVLIAIAGNINAEDKRINFKGDALSINDGENIHIVNIPGEDMKTNTNSAATIC